MKLEIKKDFIDLHNNAGLYVEVYPVLPNGETHGILNRWHTTRCKLAASVTYSHGERNGLNLYFSKVRIIYQVYKKDVLHGVKFHALMGDDKI